MKKINLFIAMSLDGYIADEKGGVDWLGGQNNDQDIIKLLLNFRLINGFMII